MINNIKDNLISKGYTFPIKIFDENHVNNFYKEYKKNLKNITSETLKFEHKFKSHIIFPWISNLIKNPHILSIVKDILGEDILCWNSIIFFKKAQSKSFVGWHEDKTYWQLKNNKVITVSIAITNSNKKNGCLKILKNRRKVDYQIKDIKNNMLARGQDAIIQDNEEFDHIELKAGECSIFEQDVVHGSDPNQSNDDRMLIAIRYIAPDNFTFNNHKYATLVSGKDNFNYYKEEPVPLENFDYKCLNFHKEIMGKQANIFAKYKLKKYKLSFLSEILTSNFFRRIYYKYFK
jgi:non-haem Fe2+, alpha-ketoglutarate-dependent halogenase